MKKMKEIVSHVVAKETWAKPELGMVSVKEITLATVNFVGDDGILFS